jgi:hypothetical protein
VLTKSERPVLEHRKWAQQFYCSYEEDHSFADDDYPEADG